MYQFVDGREILKPLAIQDSRSQKIYAPLSVSEKKDRSCGIAQTESQSSLRIVIEERVGWASCKELDTASSCSGHESPCPVPDQTTTACKHIKVLSVKSSPSTILSFTENASQNSHVSRVIDSGQQPYNEPEASRVLQNVHISARLMEDFLELAKDNTEKDLETCGVLGAFLDLSAVKISMTSLKLPILVGAFEEQGTFYVTTLIIPKQESTSNSCQAINEEEIFAIQNERSLFPVGWIHTHPSQSCFMSSIDLHTQYSYQVMVPEAFAIVVAPTDNSRSYGIFRVSDPSGMSVLKECEEKGSQFHSHKETVNGSPIYEHCTHVYKNSNLRFEIFDLRCN